MHTQTIHAVSWANDTRDRSTSSPSTLPNLLAHLTTTDITATGKTSDVHYKYDKNCRFTITISLLLVVLRRRPRSRPIVYFSTVFRIASALLSIVFTISPTRLRLLSSYSSSHKRAPTKNHPCPFSTFCFRRVSIPFDKISTQSH